jgi:hypothetical protein
MRTGRDYIPCFLGGIERGRSEEWSSPSIYIKLFGKSCIPSRSAGNTFFATISPFCLKSQNEMPELARIDGGRQVEKSVDQFVPVLSQQPAETLGQTIFNAMSHTWK